MRRLRIIILLATIVAAVAAAGAAAFGFKAPPPPNGTVGQPYSYQWVHNGIGPGYEYTYTVDSGSVPPGLNLSSSGLLSGTPTQAGSFQFYIEVTYTCCGSSTVNGPYQEKITIGIVEGLAIQQPSLPTMVTGTPFSTQLTASGGGTQTWTVVGGTLPTGPGARAERCPERHPARLRAGSSSRLASAMAPAPTPRPTRST